MRGSDLIYGCVNKIYCHFNKTSLNKKNYIESTQWFINQKSAINPKNNDEEYFKYLIDISINPKNKLKIIQREKMASFH